MLVTERVHLLAGSRHRQHTADNRVALVLEIDHLQAAQTVEEIKIVVVDAPDIRLDDVALLTPIILVGIR